MEEEKLLHILKLIGLCFFMINSCLASISLEERSLQKSEKYRNEIINQQNNIYRMIDGFDKKEFLKVQKQKLNEAYKNQGKPRDESNIQIFVSFSMPDIALKNIMNQAEKYNASVVIRGLINNSMLETLNKINKLVKENKGKGGLQIDPNLFDEYKIYQVPAIVLSENNNNDVVYGLGSIEEALQTFVENGSSSDLAKRILKHA